MKYVSEQITLFKKPLTSTFSELHVGRISWILVVKKEV